MVIIYLLSALYAIFVLWIIVSLLLANGNSSRTLLWIMAVAFVPVLGIVFYFLLGKKVNSNKELYARNDVADNDENGIAKLLLNNSNSIPYNAEKIDILANGKDTFAAMFDAICNAKEHIHIEFFIFRDDRISNQLRELLIERAKAGVEILLIYDYLGCFACSRNYWKGLREAGVKVSAFFPLSAGLSKINTRNHRKILVVDGKIGFTGGLNIADRYYFGNRLGQWRDTFVRLQGEAAQGLQSVFMADWQRVRVPPALKGAGFPANFVQSGCGKSPFRDLGFVQIVSSGGDSQWESIMQGMAAAITTAKKYVYLQTPYYAPNELIDNVIQLAALRGADVRLMLPSKSDTPLLDACTETYLGKLLRAGVKIYKYNENFMHCKTIVVDDNLSIIGSANLDERSFNQNFEVNAFIYDAPTSERCRALFENDMLRCSIYTYEEWEKRSFFKKLLSSLTRLLSPVL